jgi:exosortase
MGRKWAGDPQYSHGYLVPLFSLYLLWSRRPGRNPKSQVPNPNSSGLGFGISDVEFRPSWWGLAVLSGGVLLRLAGAYVFFDWLEAVSLLAVLAGAVLLLGGWPALRWSWPAIAFLGFMVPLPFRVETALSHPLQRMATVASTYILQTLGRPAFAEGNVIVINESRIGVVEACNGLGMLLLFFALATAVAVLAPRLHWAERLLIVATAAPVAVLANVARITVTAFLHEFVSAHWADVVFHDLAGWLMMPLALGLLYLEMCVLSRLFVTAPAADRRAPAARGPRPVRLPTA